MPEVDLMELAPRLQIVNFNSQYLSELALRTQLTSGINEAVHERLFRAGEALLLSRMTIGQATLWDAESMLLDGFCPRLPYDYGATRVALVARRRGTEGELSVLGFYATVGYREDGDAKRVVPLPDCPPDLAFSVSAAATWRAELAA